jgi:hypothetical protein
MMKRLASGLVFFLFVCLVTVASGQNGQLDQNHDIPPNFSNANAFGVGSDTFAAQSFTVGLTGWLSAIDVGLYRPDVSFDGTIKVDICRVVGGTPDFSETGVLARRIVSNSTIPVLQVFDVFTPQFTLHVDFPSSSVSVIPGDSLAIVLRPNVTGSRYYNWWTNTDAAHSYAGGGFFHYYPSDGRIVNEGGTLADGEFRTFVSNVPEPTAPFLTVWGCFFVAGFHRRQRHAFVF